MLGVLEVKGDATEASSSDKEMPPWALFSAWVNVWNTKVWLSRTLQPIKQIYEMKANTYPTVISAIATHSHIVAMSTT